VSVAVETARAEWEEGHRRLEELAGDRRRYRLLLEQVEAVLDELAKRVGATFTLEELARAHADADEWVREVLAERAASPGWPRTLTMVENAAFHVYQRGALDYEP
jgi:hypothetical protein